MGATRMLVVAASRSRLAVLLAACAACGPATQDAESAGTAPVAAASRSFDPASDERLQVLLSRSQCAPFLGDTSDLAPALVQRLADGSRDSLRWVRAELMRGGPGIVAELERMVAENLGQPAHATRAMAALDMLGSLPGDEGRPSALRALAHSGDTVRIAALAVLRNHPAPSDWEAIAGLLPGASDDLAMHARAALLACDPVRAGRLALEELAAGRGDERLCAGLSRASDPQLLAAMKLAEAGAPLGIRVHLLAGLARSGDADATAELGRLLASDAASTRQAAATACTEAELDGLLLRVARDEDPALRLLCVKRSAALAVDGAAGVLRDALDDPAEDVRAAALEALARIRDPQAIDTAWTMLDANPLLRNLALRCLRPLFEADAATRRRFTARLIELRPEVEGPAAREIDRALAMLPDEDAAQLLAAKAATTPGEIQGVTAHRWYCDLLGGMGPAGTARLRTALATERDPARRLDLIWALSFTRDDEARAVLRGIVDGADSGPYDILMAAELLVRLGPATETAPLLKRAAMKVDEPKARGALNCLLWDSYAIKKPSR